MSPSSAVPPGPATEILVIRHGQSTWNEEKRWQGQADPPLSEFGRAQAVAAAEAIGRVDAIVSSPQLRALETAEIIAELVGVGPVQVHDDLRERSAGQWSGLTRTEIDERWPGWVEGDQRPEGWEPDDELSARVVAVFDALVDAYPGDTVLVVCHGGVIISLEQHLGVNNGRISNLHGRVVHGGGRGLVGGERLELIPTEMRTGGGRSPRV